MFCTNCGKKNREGSKFCVFCGSEIKVVADSRESLENNLQNDKANVIGNRDHNGERKSENLEKPNVEEIKATNVESSNKEEIKAVNTESPNMENRETSYIERANVENRRAYISENIKNSDENMKSNINKKNIYREEEATYKKDSMSLGNKIAIILSSIAIAGVVGFGGYMLYDKITSKNEGTTSKANSSNIKGDKKEEKPSDNEKKNENDEAKKEDNKEEVKEEKPKAVFKELKDDEYIMYYSDVVFLTRNDLSRYSKEELGYIRNEIYARHGYVFKNPKYKEFFEKKTWYQKRPNFKGNTSDFNQMEKENIDLIKSLEESTS